jgi:hypothetical protein
MCDCTFQESRSSDTEKGSAKPATSRAATSQSRHRVEIRRVQLATLAAYINSSWSSTPRPRKWLCLTVPDKLVALADEVDRVSLCRKPTGKFASAFRELR